MKSALVELGNVTTAAPLLKAYFTLEYDCVTLADPFCPDVSDEPRGADIARTIRIHLQHPPNRGGLECRWTGSIYAREYEPLNVEAVGCGGAKRRGDEHVVVAVQIFRAAADENTLCIHHAVDRIACDRGAARK